jgi:hypothetical protein
VAERNSLLNCRTGNCTEGSNPSLSASKNQSPPEGAFLLPDCRCKLACKRQTGNKKESVARLWFLLVVQTPYKGSAKLIPPSPQNENEIENEYVLVLIVVLNLKIVLF